LTRVTHFASSYCWVSGDCCGKLCHCLIEMKCAVICRIFAVQISSFLSVRFDRFSTGLWGHCTQLFSAGQYCTGIPSIRRCTSDVFWSTASRSPFWGKDCGAFATTHSKTCTRNLLISLLIIVVVICGCVYSNSLRGSAVCAFKMDDIVASFEGPHKEQKTAHANWLAVREVDIPDPRPAKVCVKLLSSSVYCQ